VVRGRRIALCLYLISACRSRRKTWEGTRPAPGGLSKKLHAKAAAEKQQTITPVNQSFDERKIVVLRSDASDKTAKQNESDDHFRLADDS
jgi:hypothetical protein